MANDKLRILLADDHMVVRMGLSALIDKQSDMIVVGEATDGTDAVNKVKELRPDVVVMDLMMPGTDGITATEELSRSMPQTKVLCLTTSTSADEHRRALAAGAAGIVTKGDDNAILLSAIRAVAAGGTYVSPESRNLTSAAAADIVLTDRQHEVLTLVAQGLRTKEIANRLGLSAESVRDHSDATYRKLGASNRAEAVAIALRKRLLKL